jgi:SAM-dependent methyltransferase
MYRKIQQWDRWLTQFLGHSVLDAEKKFLMKYLTKYFGKQGLLIGVPHQNELLKASIAAQQIVLTPLISKTRHIKTIESDFEELPIASGRIDLVILPHSLEYVDNPRKLLAEACRIVKPEGHLVILGFNPFSLWGIKKFFAKSDIPWSANFIRAGAIKEWLGLADFELVKQSALLFRPPLQHHGVYRKLGFLEWIGRKCYWPFGGAYMLIAKAKVVPLTPIRLRWQQKLSNVQATLPGPSMRTYWKTE